MSEDRFDAIIVGGGVAGTVAAYLLAKEGLEVLLIERGNNCGSKNMTGGRIYTHSLEKIMPGFTAEAPVERKITREKISFLTGDSAVTLDYQSPALGVAGRDSWSVVRSTFDHWLADKAEEAGVQIINGICVNDLILRDGRVLGVIAGEDELEAEVTILADGVNSLLAQKLGLRGELSPADVAVGAKEIIELSPQLIEERFNCTGDEGTAWLFAGTPSDGRVGGGFLYTNKTSVSLGIVCTLSDVINAGKSVPQMLEDFKNHAAVAPLIKGGGLREYSGHLVPEGGLHMLPQIIGDGVLVVGDAAGFCINLGYAVRGMDFAVASAECAAKAVLAAKAAGDYSAAGLGNYRILLEESFILRDLTLYKKFPGFLESTPRIFQDYPEMIANLMANMFVMDGEPAQPLYKKALQHMKKVGIRNIVRDGIKGVTSL